MKSWEVIHGKNVHYKEKMEKQRKCMWNYSQDEKGKAFQTLFFRHNPKNPILID